MCQNQSSIKASFLKKTSESWLFVVRAVRCACFLNSGLQYYCWYFSNNKVDIFIKVNKEYFDENGKLKPYQGVIDKNDVLKEEKSKVIAMTEDDLPF